MHGRTFDAGPHVRGRAVRSTKGCTFKAGPHGQRGAVRSLQGRTYNAGPHVQRRVARHRPAKSLRFQTGLCCPRQQCGFARVYAVELQVCAELKLRCDHLKPCC